jgi:prolipoprotein diacylglyceryltransferase
MLGAYGPLAHLLFEIAAFYVGVRLYLREKAGAADPLAASTRGVVIAGAAVGALIGSRLLAALEHPGLFADASARDVLLLLYSTKTIVGGLLGGLVGVEAAKALVGEHRRSGDRFAYPLIAAIAVGRVGCFLAGVGDGTAGRPSALPWAFPQGDGVARHPTALYEIAFLLLLALGLRAWERRRALREGERFALFLTAYLAWRLVVEFLKPVEGLALGLSAIQWACVLGLLHYARLFALGRFALRAGVPRPPGSVILSEGPKGRSRRIYG